MPLQRKRPGSDERPAKRSRVSRACDQCRTAREKCDGMQPSCLTCSSSDRTCTYTAPPKKRGIQPGYIRTLELSLTWLFQNTDSEAVLNRKLAQDGSASVLFGRDTRESNRLHRAWRKSKFCKDVDKLLSGEQLGPSEDATDDEDSELEGPRSNIQDQHSFLPPEDEVSPSAYFLAPRAVIHAQQGIVVPQTTSQQTTVAATPLPNNSWRLLDIYFAYTQFWLPICEKHDILKVSYSYPESGLVLSINDLANPGDHAELWSILAVAAHQERMSVQGASQEPERLYIVARSLIPTESGAFTPSHIRALLNLTLLNLASSNTEVAWLLVGSASRILLMVERSSPILPTRWKHLVAGCFVIDSLLSLQLCRRPYILKADVDRAGPVEEDGLEEWQPWSGPLHASSNAPSRTPGLSLSSFNRLTKIVEVLSSCNVEIPPDSSILRQLDSWKVSLPGNYGYSTDDPKETPFNPQALLLQLTYLACTCSFSTSAMPIQRMLELLEPYQAQLGVVAVPPTILCLLEYVQANRMYSSLDSRLQSRIRKIESDITGAWVAHRTPDPASMQAQPSGSGYQIPRPESIQVPFNPSLTLLENPPQSALQRASASLIDDLLPDINSAIPTSRQDLTAPALEGQFQRASVRHHSPEVSQDLENFFDELASLDGAEIMNNQPQFMQNLGFAPDEDMADFLTQELSQYIPANSSTLVPQSSDPTHLDPAFFDGT